MRTYSRRELLKQTSLAASAVVGASLARAPMLHAGESGDVRCTAVTGSGIANVAINK